MWIGGRGPLSFWHLTRGNPEKERGKSQTNTFLLLLKHAVLAEVSLHISGGHTSGRGTYRGSLRFWGRGRGNGYVVFLNTHLLFIQLSFSRGG